MNLWSADPNNFSVTYPIEEILRRAKLKTTIWDRDFPISNVGGGFFSEIVTRYTKALNWKKQGASKVKVFYSPTYFMRNYPHSIQLLDPLHTTQVVSYTI